MHSTATSQVPPSHSLNHCHKDSLPTLPVIPLRSEQLIANDNSAHVSRQVKLYDSANDEKVIPGYNFESLFRKKSHIRLARKKNKEEAQKKNSSLKLEQSQKELKNTQKGHWSSEENKLYHWFLEIHNRHFILKYLRRTDKIFKSMANFIRTREAEQCRSHHQKMEKKYHNFYQILMKLRMDFYNSHTPDLLKLELEENGYKVRDYAIITEQELKNAHLAKPEGRSEDERSQKSSNHSVSDEQDKQENSLLREDYEKGLVFNIKYS